MDEKNRQPLSNYRFIALRILLESIRRDGLPAEPAALVADAFDCADRFFDEGQHRGRLHKAKGGSHE